jgi:hypothetical protein
MTEDLTPEDESKLELANMVLDEETVACEACDAEGVTDGHVCRACDGFGWRTP